METIGSIVKISIPVLSTDKLAKVDTGADSSSIHCDEHYVENDILYCKPLDLNKTLKFKNFEKKTIKTSDGVEKERYTIKLKVIINGEEIISSFTLNDRNKMDYPILIGKNILKNRFMVDVNKPYIEEGNGNIVRRTFSKNISESELIWHRDREDRIVLPITESDWYIQMDNELPRKLNINEEYFIPKNTYHRVIKGSADLVVEVIKTIFEEDEYEIYEVLEEGKKKKKKKKKDACYYKVRSRYDVWPSAYASGALVKCRKVGAKNWGNSTDESIDEGKKKKGKTDYSKEKEKGLHGWFERQGGKGKSKGWVDCNTCRKDPETGRKKCKTCGRKEGEKRAKYPSCRPTPSACSTPGKGKKWGKTDESVLSNEKNTIFVENIKDMILHRLHEMDTSKLNLTTLGPESLPDNPVKEPVVLPETKPSAPSPRRKRIWEVKPAANPKPKM